MKTTGISIIAALLISVCTQGQPVSKLTLKQNSEKVEAYYFHFSTRCVTCKTVEAEAKADLAGLYGDKVRFQAINLDDVSSKTLAEKLQVSGQSLLIVKGNTRINITNEAFLYARTNPEKLRSIIKEKTDPLLK